MKGILAAVLLILVLEVVHDKIRGWFCKSEDSCKTNAWTRFFVLKNYLTIFLYVVLFVQTLRLFGISLLAILSAMSIVFAAIGFTFKDTLTDFVHGFVMLFTQNVHIGAIVRLQFECCDARDMMIIKEFTPFSLLCVTRYGTDKYIRYNTIRTVEIVSADAFDKSGT